MKFSLMEILQSTGPIALNELSMRTHAGDDPEDLKELVERLQELVNEGTVTVTGSQSTGLATMTPEQIARSSDTIVQLSRAALRKSFAS